MSLDNLVSQPKPVLPPHEVFHDTNLDIIVPAQNAAQYLTAAIVDIPKELQNQVRSLRNNFEDTLGNALSEISDVGRMRPDQELKLATLMVLTAEEIVKKLEAIDGLGSHIPYSFRQQLVPVPSTRRSSDPLASNYIGVMLGGKGTRRIQDTIPGDSQEKPMRIDFLL